VAELVGFGIVAAWLPLAAEAEHHAAPGIAITALAASSAVGLAGGLWLLRRVVIDHAAVLSGGLRRYTLWLADARNRVAALLVGLGCIVVLSAAAAELVVAARWEAIRAGLLRGYTFPHAATGILLLLPGILAATAGGAAAAPVLLALHARVRSTDGRYDRLWLGMLAGAVSASALHLAAASAAQILALPALGLAAVLAVRSPVRGRSHLHSDSVASPAASRNVDLRAVACAALLGIAAAQAARDAVAAASLVASALTALMAIFLLGRFSELRRGTSWALWIAASGAALGIAAVTGGALVATVALALTAAACVATTWQALDSATCRGASAPLRLTRLCTSVALGLSVSVAAALAVRPAGTAAPLNDAASEIAAWLQWNSDIRRIDGGRIANRHVRGVEPIELGPAADVVLITKPQGLLRDGPDELRRLVRRIGATLRPGGRVVIEAGGGADALAAAFGESLPGYQRYGLGVAIPGRDEIGLVCLARDGPAWLDHRPVRRQWTIRLSDAP
jgi:hypothetical protein